MKTRLMFLLAVLLALAGSSSRAPAQGTAFTYEGRLSQDGDPATGLYELRFTILDSSGGPTVVSGPLTRTGVAISNGLFTVMLDFGAGVFDGSARWLEIGVRTNGSAAAPSILSPRQAVTPSPYAIYAANAGTASNVVNGSVVKSLNGLKDNVTLAAGSNVTISPSGNTLTISSAGAGGSGIWSLNGGSTYYNGGNVGIGTAMPANKLTLLTPTADYGIEHTDGNVRVSTFVGGSTGGGWLGTISNHKLSFFVNNQSASMTVDTTGNVGIGTTTPPERLTIANVFGRSLGLKITGVGPDGVGMAIESVAPGGRKWSLVSGDVFNPFVPAIAGNFRIVDETANATRLVIAPDGNVGIGNLANPQAKLDVQATTGTAPAVKGTTESRDATAIAILGEVVSTTPGINSAAVRGNNNSTGTSGIGIWGEHKGGGWGVYGQSVDGRGVHGNGYYGVYGTSSHPLGTGVYGVAPSSGSGSGVAGVAPVGQSGSIGVYGLAGAGSWAGYFSGLVHASALSVSGSKDFKIDHPLDPTNKYLVHSCIESPDRMNIYNGNVNTGGDGEAVVELPGYFSALNCDFRYQLTVLGQFAQAIIGKEIASNRFTIKTDKPNVKVSWQVTGVRQDAYARAHPMVVEPEKASADKGHYLMPELFGQPAEKQIGRIAPERRRQMEASKNNGTFE